jgi:hypothetical protein
MHPDTSFFEQGRTAIASRSTGSGASYPVRLSAVYTTNTSESEFSVLTTPRKLGITAGLKRMIFTTSSGNHSELTSLSRFNEDWSVPG